MKARVFHFTLVLLLFTGAIFSGCGGGGQTGPARDEKGRLVIKFWHAMGGPLGEILKEMIADFNKQQNDIVIVDEYMGQYQTLNQKLTAAVAAGATPHLAQVYESWTDQLIEDGQILPLDDFINGTDGVDLRDIVPVLLENVKYRGKIYSMPFNKSFPVIYYNKDMFAAAGLDPERPPQTWSEFYEYARKLTVDSNGDGTPEQWGNAYVNNAWMFECYLFQAGGRILSPDETRPMLDGTEAIEAAHYMIDRFKEKIAYKTKGYEHQNDFIGGKAAMIEGTIVSKVFMEPQIKFRFGMAKLPGNKNRKLVLSGTNVIIFNKTPEENSAAWKFLKWFTDTEQQAKWGVRTTYMPVRLSSYQTQIVKDAIARDPNLAVVLTPIEEIEFEPRFMEWYDCRKILEEAVEKLVMLEGDPRPVLAEAQKKMTEILEKRHRNKQEKMK